MSESNTVPIILHYETVDGTARHPKDYKKEKSNLLIPTGAFNAIVSIKIRQDDQKEVPEYFSVVLSLRKGTSNVMLADDQGRVTILDEEVKSNVTSNIQVNDGNQVYKVNKLKVTAYPNPFSNYFMLQLQRMNNVPVIVKVLDVSGKLVEVKDMATSNTLKLGYDYPPGIYFAEVIQEREIVLVKLIKIK